MVASENGRRPAGVVSYNDVSAADMVDKLRFVREHYDEVKAGLSADTSVDNVSRMADWLSGEPIEEPAHQTITARQ